ncbi:MAG TPA: Minf_1886 family protein, partial [Gemmatimonadales bacterium]|nr:Minf_1886 family protein [Gemmatimonadales bacterium]
LRQLALETFGFLARDVLRRWGVRSTDDFGEIVFHLIAEDLLQKTADDRKEDFAGIYDFQEAFDASFEQALHTADL